MNAIRYEIFLSNLVTILFLTLSVLTTQAKYFSGSVSAALGNAGVGVLENSEGAFANAGQLALFESKNFAISYTQDQFLAHFADNGADALFPASLGYSKLRFGGGLERSAYHLNLARAFMNKNFGVGVDLQYRTWIENNMDMQHSQAVMDLGAIAKINPSFTAGITITNLAFTNTVLPDPIDRAIGTFVGVGLGNEGFAKFRFDVGTLSEQAKSGPIVRTGLQTAISDWILTRIGYELNEIVSSKTFTIGLAFVGPQFGFHYAYQKESNDLFEERHVVDLSVPF